VPDQLTSLVLPVYNQADHIDGIVEGYLAAVRRVGNPLEVLVVTNGCTDRSIEVCETLAERHEPVRHIGLTPPGWGRAVRAGLREARGERLIYTNSARTTPEMLSLMLSYARAYPDIVLKANRKIRDSWHRRLGSLLYNLECRALFDLPTWDINGTPKVFPRALSRLMELERDDDLIDVEFAMVCRREGYPVVEVPILATVRHGGRSTTNYRSALRMYRGALELRRTARLR
jgi:glycosyltransferase involved in cell wall biosynthesis